MKKKKKVADWDVYMIRHGFHPSTAAEIDAYGKFTTCTCQSEGTITIVLPPTSWLEQAIP